MRAGMASPGAVDESCAKRVVGRWVALTLESYPAAMRAQLGAEADPFRNPAGGTIRESLRTLFGEIAGEMRESVVLPALDRFVRLRAVQDFTPADAVRFVFALRTAVRENCGTVADSMESRIDELALLAFNQYMACREQIFALRAKEMRLRAQRQAQAESGP